MDHSLKISVTGAGVMGLCAANALRAHSVTVSGRDPSSASAIAGGMLAPYAEIEHIPPAYMQAALEGVKFWESLPREKTGFVKNGSLLLAHNEDRHMLDRFAMKIGSEGGAHTVSGSEISALEPALAARFESGLYIPGEASLTPALALDALASECVFGDIDSKDFDWLIDCRGYGAAAGDPELRGVKGEILEVRNPEFKLSRPVRLMHPRYPLYIVPRENHVFTIGATQVEAADTDVSLRSGLELMSALYSLHPSFGEARILGLHAGIRPAYPDNLPRITIDGNTIRCNGLFRHGYLFAPVMAQCVADHIAGRENKFTYLFMRGNHDDRNRQRSEEKLHRAA